MKIGEAIMALKMMNLTGAHPFLHWEEMTEVRDMAISALREQEERRWIPVKDRLPEHYRNEDGTLIPFIVCVRNCKNPVVAYYNGQIWGDMGRMDVVAWAPTPEPY